MRITILLFAGVRDAAGRDTVEVQLDPPILASDVLQTVASSIPAAAELVQVSRLAVDGQYVVDDHVIESADAELALIPPVSGG